jgi:hypothetical protein
MFRHIEGCKARCGDMTLMVAREFVEWHVIVVSDSAHVIQGDRQFSEDKARAHARQLVEHYSSEERTDASAVPAELAWIPLESGDWLAWRP